MTNYRIVETAKSELKRLAKSSAREYTDPMHERNQDPEALLEAMREFPKTDRQLARWAQRTFLDQFIYITEGPRSGWFYYWNGAYWEKLVDRDFSAYVSEACEQFLETATAGYRKLLKTFNIALKAPKTAEGEDPKEESHTVAAIRTQYNAINKLADASTKESAHVGIMKAVKGTIHRPAEFFLDDSAFIVASDGWVLKTDDLASGWHSPSKERPVARTTDVPHNGTDASPELWQRYLDSIFKGPEGRAYQRYLQVAAGCALLGRGDTRQIPSLYGPPRTGKSTFVQTLKSIFGGYAVTVGRDFLHQNARFSRSRAKGMRYVLLEETDKFELADTGFIKQLAGGGGTLSTERKGVDAEEWPIQFVLFIATNNRIKIDVSDNAGTERIDYVEFKHQFDLGASDFSKNIGRELLELCPRTIFNWILEGAYAWDNGTYDAFPRPDSMFEQDNEARKEQSSAIDWLDLALRGNIADATGSYVLVRADINEQANNCIRNTDAYNRYKWWALEEGYEQPMSNRAFYDHVTSYLKTSIVKSGDGRYIRGLKYGSTQHSDYYQTLDRA